MHPSHSYIDSTSNGELHRGPDIIIDDHFGESDDKQSQIDLHRAEKGQLTTQLTDKRNANQHAPKANEKCHTSDLAQALSLSFRGMGHRISIRERDGKCSRWGRAGSTLQTVEGDNPIPVILCGADSRSPEVDCKRRAE